MFGDSRRLQRPDQLTSPSRVTHVLGRLNIGGPALQVLSMMPRLDALGYETRLVYGVEGSDEGSMEDLAATLGITSSTRVASLRRDPGPADLAALLALARLLRRDRPTIVHTHAAKAGALGRVAVILCHPHRRPVLVHTFHGHSLSGYFGARTAAVYRWIETLLARQTDALVAVSAEVRDDLDRLGVAPATRFDVIALGLDLDAFLDDGRRARRRAQVRASWGVSDADQLVTLVARLVPIKRVDRFLEAARLIAARPRVRFVIVGDGALREELERSSAARALAGTVHWAGFRRDMPDVCVASDLVALSSDNEGTPVSLIEAQAAAVPVVSTRVGGVPSAVRDGEAGILVAREDVRGFARAITTILDDPAAAGAMGVAGRARVRREFALSRAASDHDELYRRLLASHPGV